MIENELTDEQLAAEAARLDAKREARAASLAASITRARLQGESLGEEGVDWAVVVTGEGVVLVKRVVAIVSKRWRARVLSDTPLTPQDAFDYTASGVVVPDADTYKKWHIDNDTVSTKVAGALTQMYLGAENVLKKVQ